MTTELIEIADDSVKIHLQHGLVTARLKHFLYFLKPGFGTAFQQDGLVVEVGTRP